MLLPSGNNYAISLANWAYGSVRRVPRRRANAWLDAHGLANTHVVDSSGLSARQRRAPPADLVALGKIALADPTLAEIVATKSVDIPEHRHPQELATSCSARTASTASRPARPTTRRTCCFSADYAVGSSTVTVVGVLLGGENHAVLERGRSRRCSTPSRAGFHEVAPLEAERASRRVRRRRGARRHGRVPPTGASARRLERHPGRRRGARRARHARGAAGDEVGTADRARRRAGDHRAARAGCRDRRPGHVVAPRRSLGEPARRRRRATSATRATR